MVAAPASPERIEDGFRTVSLYAVCDVDDERVSELAEQVGAKAFTSFDEVLDDSNVGAVDLPTPPFLHAEQTIAAAQAGQHVEAVTLHKEGVNQIVDEAVPSDRVWLSNNNYYDASHEDGL